MPIPATRALALLPLLALAPASLAAQEVIGARDARTARVDSLFSPWDRADSPGCAVGVYQDGAIRYARGYGSADLERRVPITPRTVFDLGSTSKQLTAASVVLLAREGTLSLDDDVRRWIPELPEYERPITIRHLLHHTSGLRDYIGLLTMGGARIDGVTTEEEALEAIVRQRALNFAPGDEHLYSNSGYFLLSVIVERASGKRLRDFARERIFAPLGMERTHYLGSHDDVVPDRALAYAPRAGGLRADVSRWLQTGDGAVFSTVEELLLWDRNFYDPVVGGEAMLAELHATGRLEGGRELGYAGGLFVDRFRGLRRVSHGGAWGGYRAELMRFPDERFSVAVLCNLGSTNPSRLAEGVAEVFLAERMEVPAAAAPQRTGAEQAPAVRIAPERLRALAGTYRSEATRATRTVVFEDGTLYVGTGPRFELRPVAPGRFELVGAPAAVSVSFDAPAPGEARRLVWVQAGGQPMVFEEVRLVSPGPDELAAYAGSYFSEELRATYTLAVVDGALVARRPASSPATLRPMTRDEFVVGGTSLRFTRDGGGAVTGFLLDAGRVRGIGFERVDAR